MDTRFLQSLITVINTGSIAAAAREQNLTAAAISQRIKALESSLKCQLLSRSGHSAKPTQDCLALLPRLNRIANEVSQLGNDLDSSGLTGELRIGVISSILSGFLPKRIQYLTSHYPSVILRIVPGTSAQLYQLLLNQEIDLAIVVEPPFSLPKSLRQQHLFSENLALISASKAPDIVKAIQDYSFIQYDRKAWGGAIAQKFLTDKGIIPENLCEIDALESIVLMVKNNMGVSLVPKWLGIEDIAGDLHFQIIDDSNYQRNICILTHHHSGKERLLAAFVQSLES